MPSGPIGGLAIRDEPRPPAPVRPVDRDERRASEVRGGWHQAPFSGVLLALVALAGCGNDIAASRGEPREPAVAGEPANDGAEPALRFRIDDESVLLVWYDEQGAPHTAETVDQIPEAHRRQVRVDVLSEEGARRPAPGKLYVADLTAIEESGELVAHSVSRDVFDEKLRARAPLPQKPAPGANPTGASVVLYGTSWCGACKQARQFMKQRGIAFEDRDIEKEPGARSEMMQKAKRAGLRTQGVPVIDVNGTLMQGFSAQRLLSLLETPAPSPVPSSGSSGGRTP